MARTTDSSASRSPLRARATKRSRSGSVLDESVASMLLQDTLQSRELLGECARLRLERPFELFQRHRRRRQHETEDAVQRRKINDSRERRCQTDVGEGHAPVDGALLRRRLYLQIDGDFSTRRAHHRLAPVHRGESVGPFGQSRRIGDESERLSAWYCQLYRLYVKGLHVAS